MKTVEFFALLVSVLSASAAPTGEATASPASLQIIATTSGISNEPSSRYIAIPLHTFITFSDLSATKLELARGQEIPEDRIECRAYKDTRGLLPGSQPFSGTNAANLATNPVVVGGILCYPIRAIPDI